MARRSTFKKVPQKNPRGGLVGPSNQRPVGVPNVPTPQAMPFDGGYWNQLSLNQTSLDQALAQIQYGRTQIGQEYGFNALGQLDTSNPYNRATLLQRSYQQRQSGTTNSMAGRGQLYAGAHQRNLDEGTFQYNRSHDTLRRGAMGAYDRLTQQEQNARTAFNQGNVDALNESVVRASEIRPEDPGPSVSEISAKAHIPGVPQGRIVDKGDRRKRVKRIYARRK